MSEKAPNPEAPKTSGGKEKKIGWEVWAGVALAGMIKMAEGLFDREGIILLINKGTETLNIFGDMITGGGGGGGHAAPAAAGAHHG